LIQIAPFASRMIRTGAWPLQTAEPAQTFAASPAHVARPPGGELDEFVPHLVLGLAVETCEAELSGEAGQDFPIRQGLTRRLEQLRTEANGPLAVGAGPGFFAPLGRGKNNVSQSAGFRRMIGILNHYQPCPRQGTVNVMQVRQADGRVSGRDPDRFELP